MERRPGSYRGYQLVGQVVRNSLSHPVQGGRESRGKSSAWEAIWFRGTVPAELGAPGAWATVRYYHGDASVARINQQDVRKCSRQIENQKSRLTLLPVTLETF